MKESNIVVDVGILFMVKINFARNAVQNPNHKKEANFLLYRSLMFPEGNKPEI